MNQRATTLARSARLIAGYISSLGDFTLGPHRAGPVYCHIGATLAGAGLQAGVDYRRVVAPRVLRILETYPEAKTTSGFLSVIDKVGLPALLSWKCPKKPRRVLEMAVLFQKNSKERPSD